MGKTSDQNYATFGERSIGHVNWTGLKTLYEKETRRFMKVWAQTLAAPAVTTILFMVIFSLALGGAGREVAGMPYGTFLAPGLIVMAILQNAFANTSSSILVAKLQGNIIDVLMPPLSSLELTLGYLAGGVTRGILVGFSVGFAFYLMPGVEMQLQHTWAVIYFALAASLLLASLGVLTGIWAEKFDHSSAVTNFIIAPLSLLSGTFYSVERLSDGWQVFSSINPFFYLIDGFRYGFIGTADSDLTTGILYTAVLNVIFLIAVYVVFKRGYRLKS